jgi:hypothetical protein
MRPLGALRPTGGSLLNIILIAARANLILGSVALLWLTVKIARNSAIREHCSPFQAWAKRYLIILLVQCTALDIEIQKNR